jgi:hypothetical protein
MTDAKRDGNQIPTELGTSNADGTTPLRLEADPTTHAMTVDDGATGSDLSGDIAARDNNSVTVLMAVSSADGVTPCPVYIDLGTKKLLIKST